MGRTFGGSQNKNGGKIKLKMQINPKLIKKQFEKSMDKYDKNAVVQKIMAEKLVNELIKISDNFENILELGAGTGLLTKELINRIDYKNYTANDLCEKSKKFLDKIIPEYRFIKGNAQKIISMKKQDLIISNALFQWFKDIEKSMQQYYNLLNNDGIIAFSTFSPDNFSEILDLTGLSLEYKTADYLKAAMEKNFDILYIEEFDYKMSFDNPLELLAHMKHTGVNSLAAQSWTFADVKIFCDKYKEKYPDITLTYSPILIIGQVKSNVRLLANLRA